MTTETEVCGILPTQLYTQDQLSPILGLSLAWFERCRWSGTGPKFVKLGRKVVYRGSDILEWMDNQTRTSTSGKGAA